MNLAIDFLIYMGLQWYMAYFNSEYGLYPALSVLLGGSQLWLFYLCLQTFAYTPIARVMEEGKWTCFSVSESVDSRPPTVIETTSLLL